MTNKQTNATKKQLIKIKQVYSFTSHISVASQSKSIVSLKKYNVYLLSTIFIGTYKMVFLRVRSGKDIDILVTRLISHTRVLP